MKILKKIIKNGLKETGVQSKKKKMTNTCPNRAWSGCTHKEHVFKYKKSLKKHILACEIARKQSETEEKDLRPLLKQVVKRVNELELQVALLKQDNRNLRDNLRATIRGNYEVRGEAETPTHGFGEWDSEFFLKHLKAADNFYRKRVGHSILRRNFKEFLCGVFYVANGQTNLVRVIGTAKDSSGNPRHLQLNFKKRRLTVTFEAAVKRLFDHPFLPTAQQVEDTLGQPVPSHISKGLQFFTHYLNMRPHKKHRDMGSWQQSTELLLALASYTVPQKQKRLTRAERADETFQQELEGEGRFWRHMDPEVLVNYEQLLSDSHEYVSLLQEYMGTQPEKLKAYREAGGTLL